MSAIEFVYITKTSFLERKIHKISKMMKPIAKFINRKTRTNAVTPSTCNYYVTESVQNRINESETFKVNFRFCEESADNLANEMSEMEQNLQNEALEARLQAEIQNNQKSNHGVKVVIDGEVIVEPVVPGTYFATPVHFVESLNGQLSWVPLPDSDICSYGDISPITAAQLAEEQVPVA